MCTLLIGRGVHPRLPLVLAANRDEFHARASAPPAFLDPEHRVMGGRDLVAGGTWLGVTDGRFVTAVTNHRTHRPPDPQRSSRGALVMELLRAGSLEAADAIVGALAIGRYNEGNLLYGDAQALHVAYLRDETPTRVIEVPRGWSVLTNGELTDREGFPKIDRLSALAAQGPEEVDALLAHLHAALGDHHRTPVEAIASPPAGSIFTRELLRELSAICVHAPGYGTVSSSILLFGEGGALERWDHTEGAPCTHERRRIV
ncbi:MAG: NRDE family protein [Sandaracinaceae bacterium]|nr:NRDE family protein [Sandaracinaceae bacterium]